MARPKQAAEQKTVAIGRSTAVILAGGLGTRLRPYTLATPKPLLPVGGKPILEYIIAWLLKNRVEDLVISTGYLGKMIEDHFGDGSDFGVRISYAVSDKALGIGGQLLNASSKLPSRFYCLYGDAILDFDLRRLMDFHQRKKGALLTMALMRESIQSRYGVMELAKGGRVARWNEKPVFENDINVGCYVMEKRYLDCLSEAPDNDMKLAFDSAMQSGEPIYGLRMNGTFWDIGDKAGYAAADAHFQKQREARKR
ncbi:MAG: nucleotidyltransferase family protein [Thaumarchaeota archaeon]|nr:nucleotidyltransferase family protein [Nitrososphaerota archaeon]